jgi:hypothetical protein
MFIVLLFLLSDNCLAGSKDAQYKEAIKVATDAALKQSGIETDWLKIRSASENKAKKIVREAGLEKPAAVITFMAPMIIKQRVRIRTGDFTINGSNNKGEIKWQIQW